MMIELAVVITANGAIVLNKGGFAATFYPPIGGAFTVRLPSAHV
jgi:hypothetical protein